MLGHLLVFTLHILTLTCLPVDKAEICIDEGAEFNFEYASVGEPLYAVCPLLDLVGRNNFSVTWVRIDSQTEIASDRQARVHQDEQYLKFIPAELQDSGVYQCILRNSTNCIKKIRRVEVFRHDDGLCYNNSVMLRNEEKFIAPSLTIECPHIDIYFSHKNIQVRWFKECQPLDLDSERYSTSTINLIIKDLSSQDSGNYTCEVSFVYNGVTYNMSRAIEFTIQAQTEPEPVVIFPKNNIIDVELGAPLTLTCRVLFNESIAVLWVYNGILMAFYTEDDRVVMGNTDQTVTEDGLQHFITLNFTKVIEEDYNRQFYCNAWTQRNRAFTSYVLLKKPDPNFQGFLIAFFVSVFLVTVISIVAIRIYKVDIVLWYRSSCFINTEHKDGKLYDAYIIYPKKSTGTSSYSYEIDIFVLKVLPEVLEKQCGYRLFISGRDDLPGQAMADLVDETIAQSRRVIIMLGNIFCEDGGDDFEQKIAMYDALIQNKIKVVLIEMEKITDYTNMPESIKYLKQKQGAVRWKGKFTEAALSPNTRFWKNIRYQMPPAQRPSDKELHYIHSED
ncbi:interleukin-1 receptor type 1 [Bufo gargarizans]|uniref:interleukin-1 receptor type 1 n=1 Tax=Bufo gargarizans TaxID=30331 RepID=UPI001CF516E5|nr:interleukin-1 receptor type 1 [Bufo gargarizans]XP_044141553.1 interleukin-1 receptor type 1 [Bufo gargarizans]XP_044141554.1 interleukin-1 receptor type 1 [Bufo gargarizans]XP_044141555.1 interleukin-1 receptor type 1 [Bufo gargarizans]XP_044141556.1 interleukin-1 receptor type 1 [Bufo gargarizans]